MKNELSLLWQIADLLPLLVIARKSVGFSWQSKSRESKRQGESMIDKRINKLSQPKQTTDSPLNHCDSYSLDSRVLDCFVALAKLVRLAMTMSAIHSPR